MPTPLKALFTVAILFGLLGVILTYDGISRMRRRAVPPFNTDLYTAVWSVWPPPASVILMCHSLPGRIVLWSATVAVPAFSAFLLYRLERPIRAFLPFVVWALCGGLFGIWVWVFSLFT